MPQNGVKRSQNWENLHKAIYANFHKKKLLLPTQILFKWNFIFWINQNLGHLFHGNFSVIIARYYKHFPQLPTSFKFKATNFTVATKTAILWKPSESTQNHLQEPKTIRSHPKPSTQKHLQSPKPTITTQNHPQSARIYLELDVTGLKPSISMWEHPQSFTKHLRPTLVFM